jgi:hypothetical protein
MLDRMLFWASRKPFLYSVSGEGLAVEAYNPVTDMVRVRVSQFGIVVGWSCTTRGDFLHLAKEQAANK